MAIPGSESQPHFWWQIPNVFSLTANPGCIFGGKSRPQLRINYSALGLVTLPFSSNNAVGVDALSADVGKKLVELRRTYMRLKIDLSLQFPKAYRKIHAFWILPKKKNKKRIFHLNFFFPLPFE